MTESAADGVRRRPLWRELSSSLLDAAVADVDIRARDHMSHLELRTPASAAVYGARQRGNETGGDAFSDFRSSLHMASSVENPPTLRGRDGWRHITRELRC